MATSNHEPWETALMLTGYFLFLFISGYLFWRTGPSYKMRKKKKELGYEVSDPFGSCMDCLWGPMRRSRWERENKFFRNTEYGEPDPGGAFHADVDGCCCVTKTKRSLEDSHAGCVQTSPS